MGSDISQSSSARGSGSVFGMTLSASRRRSTWLSLRIPRCFSASMMSSNSQPAKQRSNNFPSASATDSEGFLSPRPLPWLGQGQLTSHPLPFLRPLRAMPMRSAFIGAPPLSRVARPTQQPAAARRKRLPSRRRSSILAVASFFLTYASRFSNRLSRSQASRGPVYGGASPAPSNVERFSESAALSRAREHGQAMPISRWLVAAF